MAASCGSDDGGAVRLRIGTFWVGGAAEALQNEILQACEGLEIASVEVQSVGLGTLHERLLTDLSSDPRSDLDMAVVPNDWLGALIERQLIGELPAAHLETLSARVTTQALLAVSDRDRPCAYPLQAEALALVYNPRLLPREPRTLDDIFATRLPAGVVPFSVALANLYHLMPLITSYQGSVTTADGSFAWSAAAAGALFRSLTPLWSYPGARSIATAADPASLHVQLFAEERLASFVAGPWLVSTLEKVSPLFAVAPVPPFRDAPHPARALVGYQSLVVLRRSLWSDLCHTVALRLLDPDAQLRLSAATSRLPVLGDPVASGVALSTPLSLGFWRAVESGTPMPSSSRWEHSFRSADERLRAVLRTRPPDSPAQIVADLFGEAP
jgi:arabinogalactan oligomer/maltooligosaccharide transport system substrate-binding protein